MQLENKSVIVVDDGLATGASMAAAVAAINKMKPDELYVAVPVAAYDSIRQFDNYVKKTYCLRAPEPFNSVGYWYEDFTQVTDQDVRDLIKTHNGD
jgi:putative phosphoribosyl transferase